jgi:hypothetical protein
VHALGGTLLSLTKRYLQVTPVSFSRCVRVELGGGYLAALWVGTLGGKAAAAVVAKMR